MIRGSGLSGLPVVTICLAMSFASGQEPAHNGFYLTSPLGLSSGWDQGLAWGSQQLNDTETIINGPTLAWMKSTHTTDFVLDYQPEIELFAKHPNLDAWDHASRLRFSHRVNGRLSVDIGNYFISTTDPTSALENSLLLLPQGRFDQNSFYAGLTYRWDHRTKIVFRAENTFTNSGGVIGPLAGRLDEVGTAGTLSVEHKFDSSELTGSYAFLHVDPLSNAITGGPTNVNLLNAAYSYHVNPSLILDVSGGGVMGRQNAVLGAAAVEKRVKEVWLTAGYQRYVAFFGGLAPLAIGPPSTVGFSQGLVPSDVYQVASFRAWGPVTKHLGLEAGVQRALTGVNLAGQQIRGVIAHVRVDYRLNDRLTWFARAEYYDQNVPEFVPFAGARRRYTSGLEIVLARPPESVRRRYARPPEDADDPSTRVPEDREGR